MEIENTVLTDMDGALTEYATTLYRRLYARANLAFPGPDMTNFVTLVKEIATEGNLSELCFLMNGVGALTDADTNAPDIWDNMMMAARVLSGTQFVGLYVIGIIDRLRPDPEVYEGYDPNPNQDDEETEIATNEAASDPEEESSQEVEPEPEKPKVPELLAIDNDPEGSIITLEAKYGITFPPLLKTIYAKMKGIHRNCKPITVGNDQYPVSILLPICGPADITVEEIADMLHVKWPQTKDYCPLGFADVEHIYVWSNVDGKVYLIDHTDPSKIITVAPSVRAFMKQVV